MKTYEFIKFILYLLILLLCFSVLYYSWLPEPSFKTEHYLPKWLIDWTDKYATIRTGVPFLLLGMSLVLINAKVLTPFRIFLGLFTLLLLAECGQLFLPHRRCDIYDILVGIISILIGIIIGNTYKFFFKKINWNKSLHN